MAIIGDGRKRNHGLLLLLIVMLAAAAALTWNVYSRNGDPLIRPPTASTVNTLDTAIVPTVEELLPGHSLGQPPEWHARAEYTKGKDGKYEIIVTPVARNGGLIDLASYQIYARQGEDGKEQDVTAQFSRENGRLVARLDPQGDVILRIRLHRELMTFEFTQKMSLLK